MRVRAAALVGWLLLGGLPGAKLGAQLPSAAPQAPVFKSGAELVALNVIVTDLQKRYVAGLTRDDFAVYEDGVKQDLEFFESRAVPLDLIILLDTSASMADKMSLVHEAAVGFVATLKDGDRGAVVGFSDSANVLQGLTSDRALLETAIRGTAARGATALHNALYVALKQFGMAARQAGSIRRQALAVLSDGADTSSVLSFDDVMGQARQCGVAIYTIALVSKYANLAAASSTRRYFSESDYEMRALAQESGGQAFFPTQALELKGVYGAISEELSNQYSLGYAPKNQRRDGRFRRVVVQVPGRPDVRSRVRAGYLAAVDSRITALEGDGR